MTTQAETCINGDTYANLDTYANAETYAKLAFSEDEINKTPDTDEVDLFDDGFTMEQLEQLVLTSQQTEEDTQFCNCLFTVEHYKKKPNYSADLELKLSPPLNTFNQPMLNGFIECPIDFKVTIVGNWMLQLWVEKGDTVRIIGTFNKANNYHLRLDDNNERLSEKQKSIKATLIIVEPHILIPTTQIVKAFPCTRKSFISKQFSGSATCKINYALVLGNVVHEIFQGILDKMDFRQASLNEIVRKAVKCQILLLYSLGKTEEEVEVDTKRAIKQITTWLDSVLFPNKNQFGMKYKQFIAAEQEFNTYTYGVKGNIDGVCVVEDKGQSMQTALEIKTGKYHSLEHRGQVLLYSLLISERFKNPNPDNILLYIMQEPVADGFEYLTQRYDELNNLILGRNHLAKWYKRNNKHIDLETYDLFLTLNLPTTQQ